MKTLARKLDALASTHAARRAFKNRLPIFSCSKYEHEQLNAIADRAVRFAKRIGVNYDKMTALMDVTACHCNGCCLDLAKLLDASDSDFGHDVFGIRRHINRQDGTLGGCFVPRCAMPMGFTA